MVALWSVTGCTLVALGRLDGSAGVALGSFVGCLVVASAGCLCSRSYWRGGCPKALGFGHRWGFVPLQHSCAILYPRSDLGLLYAIISWSNALVCPTVVGTGSMLPRPVVAASGLLDCFAWHPSLVDCFAWHPSFLSCYASQLDSALFLRIAPVNLVMIEIFLVEESHGVSPCGCTWGLMLAAMRAPFDRPCSSGCARLQCASWPIPWPKSGCWVCPGPWLVVLPIFGYGVSAPMVRLVPMAVVGLLCGGYPMVGRLVLPLALTLGLIADWGFLHRTSTSIRIDLHPYLYSNCHRHLYYALTSYCMLLSFIVCLHFFLMADSLLAQLGDLTFTAEEQDAILVAPDSVAIPAEDFACSLVGKVVSPPTLDGGRLIRQFRSIWKDDKLLTISEINPNFFLITFASPANQANVLKRGPWDFQKYWFALEQADPNRTIHDYSFLHLPIWVRIHNIPLSLTTAALARVLGASIGKAVLQASPGGPGTVLLAAPWWHYGVLLAAPWWPWAGSTAAPGWPWAVLWAASWWLQLVVCAAGPIGGVDAPRRLALATAGALSPLQHSCAILYPRSDLGLLYAIISWSNALVCPTVVGTGSMLPRPVVAASGLLDCFAWHPSLVDCFAWHPSFLSCYASQLDSALFLRIAPVNLVMIEIFLVEESHGVSPCGCTWGLMLAAMRAPFDRPCSSGCARLQCASWPIPWPKSGCWVCPGPWLVVLPIFGYGVSAPMVRLVPMAVVGLLCGGYPMVGRLVLPLALTLGLIADWGFLHRYVLSARPRGQVFSCFPSRRVLSCFPSHPFWAGYVYRSSNSCRTSTSIRIDLHPYLYSNCHRHLYYALTSYCMLLSFIVCLHFFLMADSLLAQLGDLTFTAEEQDAILVAPDSVAIPAEDFACSLVGKVVSPPTLDGGRLIRQFRSIWKDDKLLTISEINPNFFLITFASPANQANVLKRGPWDFQKYWFALEQADPNRTIHDYSFLHLPIWVRIHNIPLSLTTAALARVLGASIGKLIV
ncbi:hypothetical protein GQ457_03G017020 [Hibiscus cannabinus]